MVRLIFTAGVWIRAMILREEDALIEGILIYKENAPEV